MAGQPLTRRRRAAQAAAAPAARRAVFTPAARAAALADAARRGDRAAAAACGTTPSTIRAWRSRARAQASPGPQSKPDAPPVAHGEGDPDALLARASEERAAERRTLAKVNHLVRAGLGPDARALSTVASDAGRRASNLEQAAAHIRESAARLAADEARLASGQIDTLEAAAKVFMIGCLGVRWSETMRDAFWATVGAIGQAEPIEGDRVRVESPPELDAARAEIEHTWRRTAREDVLAEQAQEREAAASAAIMPASAIPGGGGAADFGAAASDPEDPPPDPNPPPEQPDGLSFDQLPEEWRRKFALRPSLGVREFLGAQRREESARRTPRPSGPSRRDRFSFRHPGLLP